MNQDKLLGTDEYEVAAASILTDYDRKVLLRLYQPIAGSAAIAFFLTLWNELDAEKTLTTMERPHQRLLSILQCTPSALIALRRRLEGLGLLHTFRKSTARGNAMYLYQLHSPMTPRQFFDYELFAVMLKQALDTIEYERTKMSFVPIIKSKRGYDDLTASFQEAFPHFNPNDEMNLSLLEEENNTRDHVSSSPRLDFDFEAFYRGLKDYQVSKRMITTEIEKEIALLATTYHLSPIDMRGVVSASLNDKGTIDLEQLRRRARLQPPSVVVSDEHPKIPSSLAKVVKTGSPSLDAKLELYAAKDPIEFLKMRNHNVEPTLSEKQLIADIKRKMPLPDAVINVVLDYALLKNNNRLSRAYIESIVSTMWRNQVTSAYEAMISLNNPTRSVASTNESSVNETQKDSILSAEDLERELRELRQKGEKR